MRIIKIDTGEYPLFPADLRERYPNVSFPIDLLDEHLASWGYAVVQLTTKPEPGSLQKVVELDPIEIDGVWTQQWAVVDLEGEELEAAQQGIAAEQAAAKLAAEKDTVFENNLPSWSQVQNAIENISNLADAKVFLGKLSRVVYLMAKNSVE